MPLWPGAFPFGVAFAVLARTSGFSALETQLLSLLVFSGAGQLAVVTLYSAGAGIASIVLTALILGLRHILYGLSLIPRLRVRERPSKPLLAFFITDENYGLAMREYLAGRGSAAFLFGGGFSLYVAFASATLTGVLFGSLLPDPQGIGLDFIFPLTFLALLLPLMRGRRMVAVATISGVLVLIAAPYTSGGVTFLIATVTAAAAGALLDRRAGAA
jgi:4-azaleucine resistance transporter AzlC